MTVSKRTIIYIVIVLAIAAVAYWLTYQHRVRQTGKLVLQLSSKDYDEAMVAMAKLKAQGVGLYPRLVEALSSGPPQVRWRSAALLGELGDRRGVEPLADVLTDSDPTVRAAAAGALGQLGDETATPHLVPLVNSDPDLAVRIAAARALGVLGAAAAVAELKAVLSERAEVEDAPAYPFVTYLDVPENFWQLPAAAAEALGKIATPEAMAGLVAAVKFDAEPDPRVRTAAAYALGDAGVKLVYEEEQLGIIVDGLLGSLNDKVGDVRIGAAHSLGLVTVPEGRSEEVARALENAAAGPHYWVREAAHQG